MSCVKFCPHNVFEEKDGKPFVARPENCVDFCRGVRKAPVNLMLFLTQEITQKKVKKRG